MQAGDIVKLTPEGYHYLRREIKGVICRDIVGLIVKKYLDETGEARSNSEQYAYDVLFAGKVALNLFKSEIILVK